MRLNRLVARANPFSDGTVSRLPTDGAEADLLREIVTTPATDPLADPLADPAPEHRRPFRLRGYTAITAAAAITTVVALGASMLPRGDGTTAPPADDPGTVPDSVAPSKSTPKAPKYRYAAAMIAVAEANQRLLLDAPGWKVGRVSELRVDSGEMMFLNPAMTPADRRPKTIYVTPGGNYANVPTDLSLAWYPAKDYRLYYNDRARGNPSKPIELLGQKGTMFQYAGTTDFATMLPPKGKNFIEIRANVGSEKAYRDLIAKLRQVDVQTWLDALPASVVRPEEVRKTVDEFLVGLPLPKGFDKQKLYDGNVTTERYHFGARVAGSVACAWIDQWVKARRSGDERATGEAADALMSSRSWKVLRDMRAEGGYPEVVWQIADEVARGQTPREYRQALGCR